MANEEHLKILKRGVQVWNRWREEHPDIQPDLTHSILFDTCLNGANLRGAHLGAADLNAASFFGADITRANLSEAKLIRSYLGGAVLREANLTMTVFNGAYLRGAILDKAILSATILGDTDLTDARGLDSCIHEGPSTIDHRTLARSGLLPEPFLRGCGLPDALINYLPSLLNEPIQLYSCFISYSHQDETFAKRLYDALQGKGVRCWYAPEDTQGGKKIHEQIDEAIQGYDKLLLILSDHSMNSEWVRTEIANARRREIQEKRRLLFPIRLVDFEIIRNWACFDADTGKDSAREIREYYIPDFSNWENHDSFEQAFARLLRDLKADETQPST
jgi:hypothetical protein